MKHIITRIFLLFVFILLKSQLSYGQFSTSIERMPLPAIFDTNNQDVYNLFDNKPLMDCSDLKILNEDCDSNSIFKIGYLLASNEKFKVVLYQEDVNENTVHFKLATLDNQNKLISSLTIMEYNGDLPFVDGEVLENLTVIKTHKEFVESDKEYNGEVEFKEQETRYDINQETGEIQFITQLSPQNKKYKMSNDGLIPIE